MLLRKGTGIQEGGAEDLAHVISDADRALFAFCEMVAHGNAYDRVACHLLKLLFGQVARAIHFSFHGGGVI